MNPNSFDVFVVGAGASASYGFPVGSELQRQLGAIDFSPVWLEETQSSEVDCVRSFSYDLLASSIQPVDYYLERIRLSKRQGTARYFDVWSKMTAQIILGYENRLRGKNFRFDSKEVEHWFPILFGYLNQKTVGWHNSAQELIESFSKGVHFLNFNYDRVLEYFFHSALIAAYPVIGIESGKIVDQIPIYHIHGFTGMPFGANRIEFGGGSDVVSQFDVLKASKLLRATCDEDGARYRRLMLERLHKVVVGDVNIVFLGFGFDWNNLKKIGFDEGLLLFLVDRLKRGLGNFRILYTSRGLPDSVTPVSNIINQPECSNELKHAFGEINARMHRYENISKMLQEL